MTNSDKSLMRLSAFLLFFLITSCSSLRTNGVGRGISSHAGNSSCISKLSQIVSKSIPRQRILKVVNKLKDHSLKSRLFFLRNLNAKKGNLKFTTQMYADTLNSLLSRGLLPPEEIPELLKTNKNNTKYILDFKYQEVRMRKRSELTLKGLEETMDYFIDHFKLNTQRVMALRELLSKAEFSNLTLNSFKKNLWTMPNTDRQWRELNKYVSYVQGLRGPLQVKALENLTEIFLPTSKKKYLLEFRSLEKSINKFKKKQFKKIKKKNMKGGMSSHRAAKVALRSSNEMTSIYSGLKYACRSAKPTAGSKQAIKMTKRFFMGIGISATAGTYAYSNWDKDKSKFDWYGKLGHDLAWKLIFQYGYNSIMTGQSSSMQKKILDLHLFYTPSDALEAAMYEVEFGEGKKIIEQKYEHLKELRAKNDPDFIKAYNKAISSLDNKYFSQRIRESIRKALGDKEKVGQTEILSLEDIASEDLDDEALKERIMESIAIQIYEQNAGQVRLGSHFIDRYAFVRAYDIVDIPKSLLVGMWVYRTMCMGGNNLKLALAKASIIYTVNAIISKFIYYELRRGSINM